ncbi:hypothetical protein, partial [Paraburkholderia caribensis]|uniref:hypothetical protein n=1 Tax=Paraburkholderia caribensis TaxID=75105 RepID=UPI0031D9AB3F
MSATLGGFFSCLRWHPRRGGLLLLLLLLASAMRYLASGVAPVRGGTYFSLPPRNYSAVTRGETTNPAKPNASALISERFCL